MTAVGTPAHGTVTIAPDGSWAYTPPTGWGGTDTFTYTATDAAGQTAGATVSIHVAPPPVSLLAAPPVLTSAATPTVRRPTSLTVTVTVRTGGSAGLATTGADPVSALLLAFSLVGAGVALSVGRRRLRRD